MGLKKFMGGNPKDKSASSHGKNPENIGSMTTENAGGTIPPFKIFTNAPPWNLSSHNPPEERILGTDAPPHLEVKKGSLKPVVTISPVSGVNNSFLNQNTSSGVNQNNYRAQSTDISSGNRASANGREDRN